MTRRCEHNNYIEVFSDSVKPMVHMLSHVYNRTRANRTMFPINLNGRFSRDYIVDLVLSMRRLGIGCSRLQYVESHTQPLGFKKLMVEFAICGMAFNDLIYIEDVQLALT